jgi:hypothetical protein
LPSSGADSPPLNRFRGQSDQLQVRMPVKLKDAGKTNYSVLKQLAKGSSTTWD